MTWNIMLCTVPVATLGALIIWYVTGTQGSTCVIRVRTTNYTYVHVGPASALIGQDQLLTFTVCTCNDAHVLLAASSADLSQNVYEIVVGGWGNTKSAVRDRMQGTELTSVHHSPLNCLEVRPFYVTCDERTLRVGSLTGGSSAWTPSAPFMSLNRTSTFQVNHVFVASWDKEGNWNFDSAGNCSGMATESQLSAHTTSVTHVSITTQFSNRTVSVTTASDTTNFAEQTTDATIAENTTTHIVSEKAETTTPLAPVSEKAETTTPLSPVSEKAETTTPLAPVSEKAETTTPLAPVSEKAETTTPLAPVSEKAETTTPLAPVSEKAETTTTPSLVFEGNAESSSTLAVTTTSDSNESANITSSARGGPPTSKQCACRCRELPPADVSAAVLQHDVQQLVSELKVQVKDTGAYTQRRTCARDGRVSSGAIGIISIVCIVVPFGLIVCSDLAHLSRFLKRRAIGLSDHTGSSKRDVVAADALEAR